MNHHPLNIALLGALWFSLTITAFAQNPTPLVTQTEDKLIAVLKSDAALKDKADACRQLAVVGAKDSVEVLVSLLADEKLTHMARYALETMTDPSVNVALLETLGKLQGRPLVGVVGTLGVRRVTRAVKPLANLLQNPDGDIAQTAARALRTICNATSNKALQAALDNAPAQIQLALYEGLLRCAERLTQNRRDDALAIYDRLRSASAPHQVRAAGLRGAILTRGQEGLPLLRESLLNQDFVIVDAAIRSAIEMPGNEVTQVLTDLLNTLPPDAQLLVIQTLGKRGDASALPALFTVAKSGPKISRLAAIRAIPEISSPTEVPVLLDLMRDADSTIAQAAQESLAALPFPEVDAAVLSMLNSSSQKLTAIDLIGQRRMIASLPALLSAASDADARIHAAALKRVGELGGVAELPALLEMLARAKSASDLDATEQAISAVCVRTGNPGSCAEKLANLFPQSPAPQKSALLHVLSAIGGEKALQVVRLAVADTHNDVHAAAIRALGTWKTADAAPDLLALAQQASNSTEKLLCLRSYLGWAANSDLPANDRLAMCQKATGLIQQTEEKKLLLSALGDIATPATITLITPYLDDAATRDEASTAIVVIAEKLLKGRNSAKLAPRMVEPLRKVAGGAGNASLAQRAKTLLKQAEKSPGGN